ncbi:MAG: DUF3494 domain-containing protein, partial [Pseudorhodobacter sp.]|nr:DUF3494 domain-containing protein [Frankiaceae bacterium]
MTAPARRPGRLALQVVLVDLLVAVVVAVVLPTSNAWSFWAAGSAPGGNGASRTASVGAGAVPVTSATRGAVSVSWAASTLSSGAAVDGYEVRRYDATGQAHTVGASCAGLVTATTCVEDGVPTGRWTWTITPLVATSWRGAESAHSMVRTVDASPPVNAISLTALSGGAALGPAARTVFYRGTLAGSFTLTNAVSDEGGSPASSQTHELGGAAAGWSHSPSTVSTPSGGPFESTAFSWLAATSSSPTEVVTGRDDSGDGAETTLEYVDDRTAPTGSTVGYRNGLQTAGPVRVTTTSGSDDASGVGGGQLQRATADLAGSTCDTFSNFVDIGPASPTSPYADDSVVDRHCYRYRFVVQDRVGNQATATSAATVRLDSSSGPPSLGTAASYSVLGGTGVVGDNVSTVSGDLGVSPSTSVTGFPARNVGGDIHAGDEAAAQAQRDAVLAYADAGRRAPTTPDFSGDLNGRTFLPGVHHSTAAIDLTGTVTLDGDGDPDAVFIFQISAALNAAAISSVTLVNGARASNVYWRVKGAVNIAAGSDFSGRILAAGAITLGSGTRLIGSALSLGTVTVSNINIRFTEARPPVVTIAGGASATTKDPTPTITGTTDAHTRTVVRVTIGSQ